MTYNYFIQLQAIAPRGEESVFAECSPSTIALRSISLSMACLVFSEPWENGFGVNE